MSSVSIVARAWAALGIRGKHFVVSLVLIVVAGGVGGVVAEDRVATLTVERVERDLDVLARTAAVRVAVVDDAALLDEVADDLGAATGARVTLIAADGRVVGDSEIEHSALADVDNHAKRPEVLETLREGRGVARRPSSTIADELLYVARPAQIAGGHGVIRLAMPLVEVDRIRRTTRPMFFIAGLVFVVLAAIGAALSSQLVHKRLLELIARTRAARSIDAADDVEALASTFTALTDALERNVVALAEERDRFDALLQAMDEGVLLLDADGGVVVDNPAARRLIPGDGRPLEKRPLTAVVDSVLAKVITEALAGTAGTVEIAGGDDGKRRVLVRVTPKPSSRPQGRSGCVLVAVDVSDIRRLETLRRDFVANVSHELRTPCSVILANTETLLSGALDDEARAHKFVEAVHRNAERLSRLIADLLDLSKIEAGKIEIASEPIQLREAVDHVVDAIEPRAREKQQTISVEVAVDLHVQSDPRALEQVLINLVDNAVKYTPANGRVRIAAKRVQQQMQIVVEDDGPGVDARHKDRLFERFYRVDAGRSRDVGGTGLGLAIVKHLVEAMDGTVRVEDAAPHGTRFIVELAAADA